MWHWVTGRLSGQRGTKVGAICDVGSVLRVSRAQLEGSQNCAMVIDSLLFSWRKGLWLSCREQLRAASSALPFR